LLPEVQVLESATVSVLINADRPSKRFPKMGEMVRVEGHKGLFLVKGVDRDHGTADLMRRMGNREVFEPGVSCQSIRMVSRQASKAIRQFLGSDLLKSETRTGDRTSAA
jgi:hypothetical protein